MWFSLPLYFQKNRLSIGFGIVILMMALLSLTAILLIFSASNFMFNTVERHNTNIRHLNIMSQTSVKRSFTLTDVLHSDDPFKNDELFMLYHELATEFVVAKKKLNINNKDSIYKDLINQSEKIAKENYPMQLEIFELINDGELNKARTLFSEQVLPRIKTFTKIINQTTDQLHQNATDNFYKARRKRNIIIKVLIFFSLLTISLAILLAYFTNKKQTFNNHKLETQAKTDSLTQLTNRNQFISYVDSHILNNPNSLFTVIFFDIDYFKNINDNYGHDIGDKVLQRFSSILKSSIKSEDILSRFGGDEFVILLTHISSKSEVHEFISKLSSSLETSIIIDNNEIFISSSIGASTFPDDAQSTSALLKNADIAMYSAKQAGRNCFKCFSQEFSDKMDKEHLISHALQTILKSDNERNELYLRYQPLHNIKDGSISEFEALIRWRLPNGEYISPDEFIPLAEKSNLIEKINLFVINEACKQQAEWQKTSIKNIRININLSGNKTIFKKLLNQFNNNLKEMNLSPYNFGIELTERTLHEISEETIIDLKVMKKRGMKISIDDFGTDYSSLINLKKLPITTLKIDKTFIDGLPDNKEDQALVSTIINLGHSLNLDVVAEGVETLEQLQFLKENVCNIAQGYYFYEPLDTAQIEQLKLVA